MYKLSVQQVGHRFAKARLEPGRPGTDFWSQKYRNYRRSVADIPCPSAVSLQYICSASAVSTSCALDRPAVHKGYPLKCSEVCFEVQRSTYFAALGLHCRRTWDIHVGDTGENSTSSKNIGGIGRFYRNYKKYRKSCQAWPGETKNR